MIGCREFSAPRKPGSTNKTGSHPMTARFVYTDPPKKSIPLKFNKIQNIDKKLKFKED